MRKATAEFDQEFVAETFGPPTPKQRAQHAKARRKRGRPRVGNGAKTISVTIEKGLLAKTDRLAKKMHTPAPRSSPGDCRAWWKAGDRAQCESAGREAGVVFTK